MTTKLSTKPRIPIPKDIQEGDILVIRDGQRRIWELWDNNGDSWCEGLDPGGHYPDGRWWGSDDFAPHKWDVVAIKRKSHPKKERPDKDAAWLMAAMIPRAGSGTRQARIRRIAKRLNGGVAP